VFAAFSVRAETAPGVAAAPLQPNPRDRLRMCRIRRPPPAADHSLAPRCAAAANRACISDFPLFANAMQKSVAHPLPFHGASRGQRKKAWPYFSPHDVRVRERAEDRPMMLKLYTRFQTLTRNEEGQDLLEYALLVALIALVAVGAITLAGTNVNTIFGRIATALAPAA
jgi:pilus assembly protein Flp/PilA